jgi:hypothetical protein
MYEYGTDEQRQSAERQRQLVKQMIEDATEDSRLVHKIIPKYPLAASTRAVSADTLDYATGRVDDETQVALKERQQQFILTRQQAEDPNLATALAVIRRAAQQLARDHDRQIFRVTIRDPIDEAARKPPPPDPNFNPIEFIERVDGSGEGIVPAIARAIATLDDQGYRTGYVVVAGLNLYRLLHSRAVGAADLPIVAVRGLLEGGPVHRSTVLPDNELLLMAVSPERIDDAEAVGPSMEFLRIEEAKPAVPVAVPVAVPPAVPAAVANPDADAQAEDAGDEAAGEELRVFRIYERYRGRFKERRSAIVVRLRAAPEAPPPEAPPPEAPPPEAPPPEAPPPEAPPGEEAAGGQRASGRRTHRRPRG